MATELKDVQVAIAKGRKLEPLDIPAWGEGLFMRKPHPLAFLALDEQLKKAKEKNEPKALAELAVTIIKNTVCNADGKRIFLDDTGNGEKFLREEPESEEFTKAFNECLNFLWPKDAPDLEAQIDARKKT